MSLWQQFVAAIEREYDRRIRAASLVKAYDPTGASHHHGQAETHNEHVEAVAAEHDGRARVVPSEHEQTTPREATRRAPGDDAW